jgi:hypothetical protein
MFLCNVSLSSVVQVSHLRKQAHCLATPGASSADWSARKSRRTVAINALREPCFPELRLKRDRPISRVLHCGTAVLA